MRCPFCTSDKVDVEQDKLTSRVRVSCPSCGGHFTITRKDAMSSPNPIAAPDPRLLLRVARAIWDHNDETDCPDFDKLHARMRP